MKSAQRLGLWLALAALAGTSPVSAEQLEGQIRRVAGRTLLIDTATEQEVVTLERGGSLTGARSLLEVPIEVPVQVTWSREKSGVKLAEVIAVAPDVMADSDLWIDLPELQQAFRDEGAAHGLTIIDARPQNRFESGHIPEALSTPAAASDEPGQGLPRDKERLLVFYSEGPRCGLAQEGARRALRQGYSKVRVLRNGLQSWVVHGGHLVVEVPWAAAQISQGTRAFLAVDTRQEGVAGPTLPGAAHVPVESMARGEFLGDVWMPSFLFVGRDASDARPINAAERVRTWRQSDSELSQIPVYVLAGGLEAWIAAGKPTTQVEDAPRWITFPVDASRGEIPMEHFLDLWTESGREGTVLLDVRSPGTPVPEHVTHIPLEELHERAAELPRDRPIVAYCNLGNRSAIAYLVLSRLGFDVRYLPMPPPESR